jgi:filamentous hemagglutinin
VRVFVLADVHDVTQGAIRTFDRLPATALRASLDPFVASSAAQALKEARADKDAMIDALRYAFAHPGELFGSLADEYAEKWRRFEALNESATLRARYEAGKLFGEFLLLLLGAISAGAGLVKLVQKVPALARVERRITRAAGALKRHGARGSDAKVAQAAPEPSVQSGKSPADAPKSNKDKALIGQDRGRVYMESRGFERLTDDKRWNAPGVDDIWRNTKPPPDYVITEYKYGQSKLGLTRDGLQMSDDWLFGVNTGRDRLAEAVGRAQADEIVASMQRGQVEKWLIQSTEQLQQRMVLDVNGNVLGVH